MSQIHVPPKKWTEITDQDAYLHVKITKFSFVYYVESDDDPTAEYPKPDMSNEIKVLASPNHGASFLNVNYKNNGKKLWMYSSSCDLYVIVE